MEKGQAKPRKDKKKNTETGLLMGQNTNIFSQLSATYLQNKNSHNEEQQNFVRSTQIVEYHDPKINRLIALLRKKADVTKAKAAVELREQFQKMSDENLEQFIPTFAQLFLQCVINEQSKQVIDQFVQMMNYLLVKNKKIAISQISTLYAPFLVINRSLNLGALKSYALLFNGSDQQLHEKALTLLLIKKDVPKKFLIFCKNIIECEESHKIGLQNYQRNCTALMKVLKDFIIGYESIIVNIYQKDAKKAGEIQKKFSEFFYQIDQILHSQFINEYFKIGGKAKGAILQMYQSMIMLSIKHQNWKIQLQKYAKRLSQHFLDKQIVVQQSLWKHCNKQFIQSCLKYEKLTQKEPYSMFTKYLPKPDDKLLSVLKLGGLALYKQLPSYLLIFPLTTFSKQNPENHKSVINKINFIRKLMSTILTDLEDQNEARILCYYNLTKYFITSFRQLIIAEDIDEKKLHEIKQLLSKAEKELIDNLQTRYYTHPPASRNAFTYYVPSFFCRLLQQLQPSCTFQFKNELTLSLYKDFNMDQPSDYASKVFEKIFDCCKDDKKLLSSYLQKFPSKNIQINLDQNCEEPETSAKIFLLSVEARDQTNWFKKNWDWKIKSIVYDPRITQYDLNSLQQSMEKVGNLQKLYFNPTHQSLPKNYDTKEYDAVRLDFFLQCLSSHEEEDIQMIPVLLPLLKDKLLARHQNKCLQALLAIYNDRQEKLRNKKWIIGTNQVFRIKVVIDVIIELVLLGNNDQQIVQKDKDNKKISKFLQSLCLFSLVIYNYKLESESEEILKLVNKLTFFHNQLIDKSILESVRQCLKQCYLTYRKSSNKKNLQDRQRRNRLDRCLAFIKKLLWHCMSGSGKKVNDSYLVILEDIMNDKESWQEADYRSDLWEIVHLMFIQNNHNQDTKNRLIQMVIKGNVQNSQYQKFLAYISCCQLLLSLQRHPEAKRMFVQLQNQIFAFIWEKCKSQQKLLIFKSIIKQAMVDQSMTIMHGAKNLLKSFMKNYQDLGAEVLRSFVDQCLNKPLLSLKEISQEQDQLLERKTLLIISLSAELPLLDIPNSKNLYDEILQKSNNTGGSLSLAYTAILSNFWEGGIGSEEITEEQLVKLVGKCLQICISPKNQEHINFKRYTTLTIYNGIYNLKGSTVFKDYEQSIIEKIVWPKINNQSKLHGAVQSSRLKYISKIFFTANDGLKKQIMKAIPDEMLADINSYKEILDEIENNEDDDTNQTHHYENIIEIFIQSAEVLIKIAEGICPVAYPRQEAILGLLQCPFPGVKRTSFILLKRMYELNLVQKAPPKQFSNFLRLDNQKFYKYQLDATVANEISKYFYSWQAILLRRNATERLVQASQEYNATLEDYLQQTDENSQQPQQLYQKFLKSVFEILENQLEYTLNEEQFYNVLTPEQLSSDDTMIVIQDQLNLRQKIYRLSMKTLFMFILNFPLFLKQFMDKNKKYKNVCQRALRNLISDAIFQEEIKRIEIREPEWKAEGNFDIYVTPKNKEIYAQYTHDVIRIGLRLVMRSNYPITPITIEFGQGLKLDEGSRWALMLQSQLHNRNNTIINGIILWKDNIDKKLSGAEECAICFDIVNSVGQLPKKGCKTCKKKFHSNCVMKWFNKSNKSECPLCKSQFL